jgi:uncharacterized membrane protein YeaQ/YmgE (transglycosylase-associated protein family)
MNIATWLLVGGLAGWQASMLVNGDGRQGLLLNIGVGIIGAVIGGWLFISRFGTSTLNEGNPSVGGFLVALLGAVVLLALMKLTRGIALR